METPCPKFGDNKIYQLPLKELKITPAMTRFHQFFLKVESYKKKRSTNEMHEYAEMAEREVFKFLILFYCFQRTCYYETSFVYGQLSHFTAV